MKYLIPILILATLFLFQYCKSSKYTPEDYPAKQITFGSGGGFAGTYTHYYLFDNGQLFTNSTADKTYKKLKKVKKAQVTQIFRNFEVMNMKSYQVNDPGNMSYYMEFKEKESSHKIQWGGNNQKLNKNVQTIYDILMSLTKK